MRDFYFILGVSEDADADEIERAYRQLASERADPPGRPGEPQSLEDLKRAFETLGDEERRRGYDARLASLRRPHPGPSDTRWFADEVSIDFPSVRDVVQRMLGAFFGEDERPSGSAEIVLTPHEAFHGARIPVDVAVRCCCQQCGGRGEIWMDACAHCGGTGLDEGRHRVRVAVPAGVRDGARLRCGIRLPDGPTTPVDVRVVIR